MAEVGPEGLLEVASPATSRITLRSWALLFKGSDYLEGSTTLTLAPDEQFSVQELQRIPVMGLKQISRMSFGDEFQAQRVWHSPNGPLLGVYREGSTTHNGEQLDLRDYLKSPVQPHSKMNSELWAICASIISMLWDLLA